VLRTKGYSFFNVSDFKAGFGHKCFTDINIQWVENRGAQTGVFELDIRISNSPYIDVCQSLASEIGLKSRNVEKRINAV
jgi:hypothetical protein